jgi:hypothetical protein
MDDLDVAADVAGEAGHFASLRDWFRVLLERAPALSTLPPRGWVEAMAFDETPADITQATSPR